MYDVRRTVLLAILSLNAQHPPRLAVESRVFHLIRREQQRYLITFGAYIHKCQALFFLEPFIICFIAEVVRTTNATKGLPEFFYFFCHFSSLLRIFDSKKSGGQFKEKEGGGEDVSLP